MLPRRDSARSSRDEIEQESAGSKNVRFTGSSPISYDNGQERYKSLSKRTVAVHEEPRVRSRPRTHLQNASPRRSTRVQLVSTGTSAKAGRASSVATYGPSDSSRFATNWLPMQQTGLGIHSGSNCSQLTGLSNILVPTKPGSNAVKVSNHKQPLHFCLFPAYAQQSF